MKLRSFDLGLTSLFASVAFVALTASGCSSAPDEDPSGASSDADETESELADVLDDHGAEAEGVEPASDDPAIGAVYEDPNDPDYADAEGLEIDLGETWDLDALKKPVRVKSPVPGKKVTYPYGVKNRRYAAGFHTGQDYATPTGSRVVAVRSGKIRWSNNNGGAYGRWMGLDADNGRTYVYCHLSKRLYGAGKRVKAGQLIARSGATGNVTGPHLHFEDHPKGSFRYAQVRKPKW